LPNNFLAHVDFANTNAGFVHAGSRTHSGRVRAVAGASLYFSKETKDARSNRECTRNRLEFRK
jgi:hypothetical protein